MNNQDKPKNWLVKRLSPNRAKNERWVELTESIQQFWDEEFEPHIDSYERLRSIFTADEEGIDQRLAELGSKFEVALPILPSSKAIAYSLRAYEIHRKDRRVSIEEMLQRDFKGAVIKWLPLFAVVGEDYGTRFLTEIEVSQSGLSADQVYRTNRGKTLVNAPAAHESGYSNLEIQLAVERKLKQVKPAHIVYDGVQFISIFVIPVKPVKIYKALSLIIKRHWIDAEAVEGLSRFDLSRSISTIDLAKDQEGNLWRLDMGWWINGKYRRRAGLEGDKIGLISNLAKDSFSSFSMTLNNLSELIHAASSKKIYELEDCGVFFTPKPCSKKIYYLDMTQCLYENLWRLDMGWLVNNKFRPVPGIEGDKVNLLSSLAADSSSLGKLSSGSQRLASSSILSRSFKNKLLIEDEMSNKNCSTVKYKLSTNIVAQSMPSFDELPLDFAPLDMYYEE